MDITRHNFQEELENIIAAIKESTFLAIDGEFTGLDVQGSGHAAPFDTPKERYSKIRNGCTDFLLIQFGLCAFKVDVKNQRYEAKPFNFYIFPKPYNRHAPDRRFLCQSSSIDFLISQGFDFNKLFKEGIPYLTPELEHKLKTELGLKHEEANRLSSSGISSPDTAKKALVTVPDQQKPFLNNICEQILMYLESEEDSEPLKLLPCNAFQRKLIYQTVKERFPLVHLVTKTGEKHEKFMVVTKTKDNEERLLKELQKQNMEKMELDLQVGFSKVVTAITESGKLVVGHNMLLDVVHIVNQFYCSLPEDLDDFKAVVKSVLPGLLDTKLMTRTAPFQEHFINTGLEDVQLTLKQPPFSTVKIETADGFNRYDNGGGAMHEAGYDAYITGCCFASLVKFLGTFQDPPAEFLLPTSHVIEPFVNKLFLMRIYDIPYLNLNGPDLDVDRDHIFHVTFPKQWRPSDLHNLFNPFGNIQVSWLTDTSAFVGLYKKENAKKALTALSQDSSTFQVVSYAAHQRSQSTTNGVVSSSTPGSKRKLTETNTECSPSKIQRQSLSLESPSYPVIPEEDESAIMNTSTDQDQNVATPSNSAPPVGDKKKTEQSEKKQEDKLFEETETW